MKLMQIIVEKLIIRNDKNCQISKDELMKILKLEPKEDPFVAKLINLADKNGDGNIDYKEFLQMMGYKD